MGVGIGKTVEFCLVALRHPASLILKHEVIAADDDLLALDGARDAVRHDILHAGVIFLVVQAAYARLLYDGIGQRVRIVLLEAGSQTQHIVLAAAAERNDLRHARLRIGQRARLIEHDRIRFGNGFEEAPALDGHVPGIALAHGRQHGDRHGKLQGAGEVHHQNGKRLGDIPGKQPHEGRSAERIGHEPVRQTGGAVLRRGFQLFGLLDHADDAVIAATAHGLFDRDEALALLHDRSGIGIAARLLAHGKRLARHGRLVHHGLAAGHAAVERDHVAGTDDDAVARVDVLHGDKQLLPVRAAHPRAVDVQRHGPRQIGDRLLVGPVLQNLAKVQHEHHGARRVEIAADQ